jgi:hypothetical protein
VYSVVPSDGSGDLSFTRASNGTRVNSAGLVEVCPWNLITYSEQIDNPAWAKEAGNSIIADTTTAPYGTLTADTISVASSFNMNTYEIVSTNEGIHTYSVYLKKNVTNLISLYIYQTFGASGFKALGEINFDNGTFTVSVGTGTIESVGNGWFRLTLTATLLSGANSCGFYTSSTTGTRTVYAWGAQLNIGSTAKPYFPTTDRLNVPRLTYQNGGGGCPSLLLEKQSTNLFSYSEQFDNAYWSVVEVSVGANVTTSPDGTQNADSIIDNANSGRHIIYRELNGNLATTRTLSLYAKQNSLRYLFMSVTNAGDSHCYSAIFDLQTGTVSATKTNGDGTLSASIQSVGNGYYRCIISGTMTSGTANFYPLIGTSDRAGFTGSLFSNNAPIYAGSGQSIYIWGAQVEESSYPTSYIPTTSASATRVADACSKTGISSLIGQTEGVAFIDFDFNGNYSSGGIIPISLDGGAGNELYMWIQTNGTTLFEVYNSSTSQVAITGSIGAVGRKKIAFAYKQNDFAVYLNGTQVGTDTSGTVPTMSRLFVGKFYANDTYNINAGINQAILFKTRLTNAELASLTTI